MTLSDLPTKQLVRLYGRIYASTTARDWNTLAVTSPAKHRALRVIRWVIVNERGNMLVFGKC